MSDRQLLIATIDDVFKKFREKFIPEDVLEGFAPVQSQSYYRSVLDPLTNMHIIVRKQTSRRKNDNALAFQVWVNRILTRFQELSKENDEAARVAWSYFVEGLSIRDCATKIGLSYWKTRNYLRGIHKPDVYKWFIPCIYVGRK